VLPVFENLYDAEADAGVPDYDPAAANAALDAAGFRRGADGVRSRDGTPLELGITTQSGDIDGEIAEQILIAELKAIGVAAYADNKSGIAYRQARYRGAFDLQYGHIFTAADPVYSMFYGTHGPLNGRGYSSAAMDAALARMETSLLPAERRAASAEMQRILARDLPTLPLLSYVSIAAKTDRLQGYVTNPTNMTDFISVAHWWLAPRGKSP
jgi:peptide/nickel transport system substrate-binding protein